MSKYWVAVASAEHVRRGRAEGFMQVCHGKAAPLRRIQPGDGVVYYSPTEQFRGKGSLQAFTALGVVLAGEPYSFDMGGGFCPYRRNVAWKQTEEIPIRPLLAELSFTANQRSWGYQLRFGLFEISHEDFEKISQAMLGSL